MTTKLAPRYWLARLLIALLDRTAPKPKPKPETITLIPLAMITPTEACICAPSRIQKSFVIRKADLPLAYRTLMVSLEPDGKSNPRETLIYGHLTGYWMVSQ